jgi:hypothetical protein
MCWPWPTSCAPYRRSLPILRLPDPERAHVATADPQDLRPRIDIWGSSIDSTISRLPAGTRSSDDAEDGRVRAARQTASASAMRNIPVLVITGNGADGRVSEPPQRLGRADHSEGRDRGDAAPVELRIENLVKPSRAATRLMT